MKNVGKASITTASLNRYEPADSYNFCDMACLRFAPKRLVRQVGFESTSLLRRFGLDDVLEFVVQLKNAVQLRDANRISDPFVDVDQGDPTFFK